MGRKILLLISVICFSVFSYILVLLVFVSEPEPTNKSKEIHAAFILAEEYIDSLAVAPSRSEMDMWFKNYRGKNKYVNHLIYAAANVESNLPRPFGEIPTGSYQLAYWRSEWMEVYASWSKKSTMCAVEKTCHTFKELRVPLLAYGVLGLFFLWGYNRLRLSEKSA